ncbi:MAG: hypothetical protein KatS3mg129_0655 [Leptospiraceae bacterium]|nr:MAG: hypothetical protein KatS3mg129_0655 [Leptospiraceae bacterium]
MKVLFYSIFLVLFLYCISTQEIPAPFKGSFENPIKVSGKDAILTCIKNFNKEYQLKIQYIDTIVGIDFHFVDKFSFPYKKWIHKKKIKQLNIFDDIPDEYYFYVDMYHKENECQNKSIENILEFPK